METGKLSSIFRVGTSVPVLTLLLLVIFDVILRQWDIPDELGFRSADIGNLAPRLVEVKKKCPEVCLVGSSQILVINPQADGAGFYDGHPAYFNELLRKECDNPNVLAINLGTDLQMISEAYLISEAIANNKCKPAVIIYGIAFREFIHDAYALEWVGENFYCVAPFVPINPYILGHMSSWDAEKELVLGHYWYLYRDRLGFKNMMSAWAKDYLENYPLDESFPRLAPPFASYVPRAHGYLYEQWIPRKMDIPGAYRANPAAFNVFFYNLQAGIYPGDHTLANKIQTSYFINLCEMCHDKGIKLVVVDMPLAPTIMKLPAPGMYEAFQKFLQEGADHHLFTLIDLYGDPQFNSDSDFKDGVHLNYEKSKTFAERVLFELRTKHPEVLAAIREHAQQKNAQEAH